MELCHTEECFFFKPEGFNYLNNIWNVNDFWCCRQYTSGLDLNLHSPQLFLMTPCIPTRGLNLIFLAKKHFLSMVTLPKALQESLDTFGRNTNYF